MTYDNSPRLQLIQALLGEKSKSSTAFEQYQAIHRKYGERDTLYMREAHFVMAVGPGEGKTMSEIADILNVSRGAVSQTAARLEKKGYILRRRSQSNYRQIVAILTPEGERLFRDHLAYDNEHFAWMDRTFLSQFSDDQLRLFQQYEQIMYAIFTSPTDQIW